ncbi:MAG: SRPBCC family protein [bacterium]
MATTAEALFDFHADVANLPVITPPFPPFRLLSPPKASEVGDEQLLRVGWPAFGSTWTAKVVRIIPGLLTEDIQTKGPFRRWRHQHQFRDVARGRATLTDVVSFRLLPTVVGEFVEFYTVRPLLLTMFRYRHRRTRAILANHNV